MTPDAPATRGRSRFVSNAAALAASTVLTALLTLAQVKILAGYLPPESFGSFAALRGFSLLAAMVAANGFPQLLVRFLPYHESKRRLARSIALSGACFIVPLFILTVVVFLVELNRPFFFGFLPSDWPIAVGQSSGMFLWLYAATLGVTLKLVLYGGFNGLRRFPVQVTLEVTSLAVQVVWIFLWRDHLTLTRLFMILAATSLGACAIGLPWYFARLHRDVGKGPAAPGSTTGPGYGGYWLGATGMSLVAVAFTDVDRYVLTRVLALEVLSQFHVGSRVLRLANRVLSVPVLAFQPEISRLDAERRSSSILSTTTVFFKFNAALATATAFAVAALAPEIIRLVSDSRYDSAAPLLQILAVSIPLTAMTAPVTAVMKAMDQVRGALYCDLVWAVVYIVLLLQLGSAFGLTGVGAAQVLASFLQLVMALSLSRVRPAVGTVGKVFAKSVLGGAVAFSPLILFGALLPAASAALWTLTAGLLLLAAVLFRIMVVKVLRLFTNDEREALLGLMNRRGLGALAKRVV